MGMFILRGGHMVPYLLAQWSSSTTTLRLLAHSRCLRVEISDCTRMKGSTADPNYVIW